MISKVHPSKVSNDGEHTYRKIEMILKPEETWCYTYISESNYNWDRWEKVIDAPHGIWVEQLDWHDECKKIIDADSKIIFHNRKYDRRNPIDQLELF